MSKKQSNPRPELVGAIKPPPPSPPPRIIKEEWPFFGLGFRYFNQKEIDTWNQKYGQRSVV
jgi:hypothetical protein